MSNKIRFRRNSALPHVRAFLNNMPFLGFRGTTAEHLAEELTAHRSGKEIVLSGHLSYSTKPIRGSTRRYVNIIYNSVAAALDHALKYSGGMGLEIHKNKICISRPKKHPVVLILADKVRGLDIRGIDNAVPGYGVGVTVRGSNERRFFPVAEGAVISKKSGKIIKIWVEEKDFADCEVACNAEIKKLMASGATAGLKIYAYRLMQDFLAKRIIEKGLPEIKKFAKQK